MAFVINDVDLIRDDHEPRSRPLSQRGGDVYLVAHHSVSRTRAAIIATFKSSARTVTANLAIGPDAAGVDDYKTTLTVDIDRQRAYTTSSWIDDIAVTFEMANLVLAPPWPVGDTGKRILVDLIVWLHQTYGMPVDRWHVTCHSEVFERGWGSYPTACCGDDLRGYLDEAVAQAQRELAGGGGTTSQGDDDMRTVIWNGNHIFTFGPQQVTHETDFARAQASAFLFNPGSKLLPVDNDGLTALCESLGVPWVAVQSAMTGTAYSIDGSAAGHFWSRELDIQRGIKLDPTTTQKTITDAIAAALKATPITADVDAAEIARAVNNEAAERMRS